MSLSWERAAIRLTAKDLQPMIGRLRDECLNVTQFTSPADAAEKLDAWRFDYNGTRPHSSIGNLTPNEFARKRQDNRTSEAATF